VAVLQGEIEGLSCKLSGFERALRDHTQEVAMLRAALANANNTLEAAGLSPVATAVQVGSGRSGPCV
jgi:hypothetical protein